MIDDPLPELLPPPMPIAPLTAVKNTSVKTRGGRPLLEDVPRRNEHLLDIATEIFVRLGYNATTLDRIAAEAGVAKRTIYARYPDKQALFFALAFFAAVIGTMGIGATKALAWGRGSLYQ